MERRLSGCLGKKSKALRTVSPNSSSPPSVFIIEYTKGKMTKQVRLNRRKSQEQFVSEVNLVHNFKYTYEHLIYQTSNDVIRVTCPEHGVFEIKAGKHRSGQGCKICGKLRAAKTRTISQEKFIEQCRLVHGDKYDHSYTIYTKDNENITVVCWEHGKFTLKATKHKQGDGCAKCGLITVANARRVSAEVHIERFRAVHGDRYDYSESIFTNSGKNHINVRCKEHGIFPISPDNHSKGHGCPACAGCGYSKNKPGTFYVLVAGNITKVGITNRPVDVRLREINTSGLNFAVHTTLFSEDGKYAAHLERKSKAWLCSRFEQVNEVFDGYTECYHDVPLESLLSFILSIK